MKLGGVKLRNVVRTGVRGGEVTKSMLLLDAAVVGQVCSFASLFLTPYHDLLSTLNNNGKVRVKLHLNT